ncbi:hypothetical protein CQA62_06595 [Helicobacter cholecystus]|uniref:Uncharacterized protein n=1 Tax=Helicobacter cholecystus TaxID=45498 RepID=A0A3D8IU86_9HELI|nr:hypothetical protein [Helicobacter cholecystus]RDU68131.1 hypothetical protein CQA62_06595 [Helicobacter cholecystus]VEJ24397.1 Uncharacterised protein [Helicobacter cholecystus]
MSALEKLISKIDALCQKIEDQKQTIKELEIQNELLEETLRKKEVELSDLLARQSSEDSKLEALFSRVEGALER